jgi:hypothetical protein
MTVLLFKHPTRVVKAIATNFLAAVAPGWYSRWTGETGRGRKPIDAKETAAYFVRCADDYRRRLKLDETGWQRFLVNKTVLEYGPGDIPGVARVLQRVLDTPRP